jgi:hypothetical protein
MVLWKNKVSEDLAASIFSFYEMLVYNNNTTGGHNPEDRDMNLYPTPAPFTLKIEAACYSETLVYGYKTTFRHNPEDLDVNFI